jgi:hypothetical protein
VLTNALNLTWTESDLKPDELARAEKLRQEIYAEPSWTFRR